MVSIVLTLEMETQLFSFPDTNVHVLVACSAIETLTEQSLLLAPKDEISLVQCINCAEISYVLQITKSDVKGFLFIIEGSTFR